MDQHGVTLVEAVFASLTLLVAFTALLGVILGQMTMNEHARNLTLAVHDANRVLEQIRQDNVSCTTPEVNPTNLSGAPTSWDAWLQAQGKSLSALNEQILVTCLRQNPSAPPVNPGDYCGMGGTAQIGSGEWRVNPGTTSFDPIQLTVSVCWRHRGRVLGECQWNGAALLPADGGGSGPSSLTGIIESPASLTTLVTCRG